MDNIAWNDMSHAFREHEWGMLETYADWIDSEWEPLFEDHLRMFCACP